MIFTVPTDNTWLSLIQFHGFSPVLRTLHVVHHSAALSEVFGLICSFPSLEDLTLLSSGRNGADVCAVPPASPKLNGVLCIGPGIRFVVPKLLALPGVIHFRKITITCGIEDAESITPLVAGCSDSLKHLSILYSHFSDARDPPSDLSKATKPEEVELG